MTKGHNPPPWNTGEVWKVLFENVQCLDTFSISNCLRYKKYFILFYIYIYIYIYIYTHTHTYIYMLTQKSDSEAST